MTISFTEQSAVTVSTTPISLINGTSTIATTTTKAIVQVEVDVSAMAAGDQYQLTLLEKVVSGGSQLSTILITQQGEQSGPWLTPAFTLGNGWDFSLVKLAGTDRAFSWSVREVS